VESEEAALARRERAGRVFHLEDDLEVVTERNPGGRVLRLLELSLFARSDVDRHARELDLDAPERCEESHATEP
jgi:hypothetical protein